MDINSTIKLNNGIRMPLLGLGTWQTQGKECEEAVEYAINQGYRHIDTAAIYGNEFSVGRAIKTNKISRNKLFVTTKLWNTDHNDPIDALNKSLEKLQMDYVDLYLIHWPVPGRIRSWKILSKKYPEQCRSLGVSNFTVAHLQELIRETGMIPAVNQVEFHVFLYQKELLEYCISKEIVLEAYSPLARGEKFGHPIIKDLSLKYNKSEGQLMIKWLLQHNIPTIPKSSNKSRIKENKDIFDFEISKKDMKNMDTINLNYRTCWDPTKIR